MFNVLAEINWLAVLVAFVAWAVIGGVYFGALIAKPYAVALGRQNEPAAKPPAITFAGPMITGFVMVVTTAVLSRALGIDALGDAIAFGLIVGIGYLAAMTVTIAINPNFPRPLFYAALNAPGFVLSGVVASVILGLWR
jgi:hypothetical protein